MLHDIIDGIRDWLGVDDDVVAVGLTVLALGAIAQIFSALGKVFTFDVEV